VSGSRKTEAALVVGLLGALGVALWAGRHEAARSPDEDPRASSFGTGPQGSGAVFDVLDRLGWVVERRRRPLLDLATAQPRPAVLLELAPVMPLSPAELAQTTSFILDGGAVVAAGEGGGIAACAGWAPVHGAGLLAEADTIDVRSESGLVLPPVSDVLDRTGERTPARGGCADLVGLREDTLLVTRDGRPVVVDIRYARGGRLTLWADAAYFRNETWRAGSAPYFVAPLLVPERGAGPIVWDEYHQGFGAEASLSAATWQWLAGTPGGWALLQLVGVVLVGVAGAAVRFGPARPVIVRSRRSPLEHLEALAAGLEGARGSDVAVRLAVAGLRRRLARVGRATSADDREWLATLERAAPTPAGQLAVRRLERSVHEPGGPERALAAAQAVEDVWEELHPRTTRVKS